MRYGGGLTERIRVVDDRREEVHRVDDGEIRSKAEYSRIVGRLRADNQVRMFPRRKGVQNLQQVGGAELRRSTGCGHLLRQPRQLELLTPGNFHRALVPSSDGGHRQLEM